MQIHIFAKKIGKNSSQVHKYIHANVMPKHDVIVKIYIATLGAVSANDFHRLSDKLFEKEKLHANSFHDD
ncbi:hypothetical protein [Candidatus Tisiphia endosymbiont of Ptychoptera albimana]|uniref:hypothetical protein n=1 Tax=Candidatus Tisiphia endosymbiont of Ptychoptera albimana TaxID=3066260 RepID=UPI00312C85C7